MGAMRTFEEWQAAAQAEWRIAVESVKALAAHEEPVPVSLAIEPLNRFENFLINNVEQGLRFAREVGSRAVRLNLDTFHMNIEEPDLVVAIHSAGSVVANVHIFDSSNGKVGSGHIDFGVIIRALEDIGYTDALTLEPTPPYPNGFLTARAVSFLSLRE
jgi:D-psicose/D-tagatose/L-ribulose 3-epimerase